MCSDVARGPSYNAAMSQKRSGAKRPLQVLMVEDSENDALLLGTSLDRGGFACNSLRVHTRDALIAALKLQQWDVILADHSMPQFSAPEALKIVQELGLDIPFIIVSGHIEEFTAVEAMKAGAHDYVMKDRLARLVPAVERELREAQMRGSERKFKDELEKTHRELELRVEERTADLKRAKEQLERLLEERHRLETELLDIAENERRRIGFDLHDDLGQKLTGANMMVKALEQRLKRDKHPAAQLAGEMQALVEQMLHHTHDLARQFSSLDAQGSDLVEILKGLSENAGKMFKLPVSLQVEGSIPPLSPNSTVQLHKIAQEAVSNAVKHGKASGVEVRLTVQNGTLDLTIQNDGIPFSVPAAKKNRMGLRIMNYRANTIGATLEINPLESGTRVACSLPVQSREAGRMSPPAARELVSN